MSETLVDLSRLQFAVTALYHFLFVPLTLGLAWILVIMESVWLITRKQVYQDMTRFWGKLFGINFALGIATGLTLEFQFGTNWAYYSHYVGDVFGTALALEGLMAFFLESTFVGMFFFGWERLTRLQHWLATVLMAIGSNLSALWILIANGWMQDPVGAVFNPRTLRMELESFGALLFNPTAQSRFVHTVSAGYLTAAGFVLGVSAWYLLRQRDIPFARRSFRIAAAFGFASALSVIVLGDESGYILSESQQTKMAAIEAVWETEPAPAGLTLFALPDAAAQRNRYELRIPWLMGLIGTRSLTREIPGIRQTIEHNRTRIRAGREAVIALDALRRDPDNPALAAAFDRTRADLGFGLLLKRYVADVRAATPAMIDRAARDTIPRVAPLFWSFRVMVALGFSFLALFTMALWRSLDNSFERRRGLLRWALYSIPLPWLAAELGWVVAEYGRQPWAIYGILPTGLAVSDLPAASVAASLAGFVLFYSALLALELMLMFKYARLGPSSLGSGRYHFETRAASRREEA